MTKSSATYLDLPFTEAITFFRDKISMPTKAYDDLDKGMHAKAFVVAGVTRDSLLSDIRSAVDSSIADGGTLASFAKDFDKITARHGWSPKGGAAWRSNIIMQTNTAMAYSAGRYKGQQAVKAVRPYLRYLPSSSRRKREEHKRYYNLVLPQDHAFWATHYPPNGWGCHCGVTSASGREVDRLKAEGVAVRETAPEIEMVEYVKKSTGEVRFVAEGCDPGFDYNPGAAKWGASMATDARPATAVKGHSYLSHGLGKIAPRKLSNTTVTEADIVKLAGKDHLSVLVGRALNGEQVADVLTDPDEIWAHWAEHADGKVAVQLAVIRAGEELDHVVLVGEGVASQYLESEVDEYRHSTPVFLREDM